MDHRQDIEDIYRVQRIECKQAVWWAGTDMENVNRALTAVPSLYRLKLLIPAERRLKEHENSLIFYTDVK